MTIVQINTTVSGSTGKIMLGIHNELKKDKYDSYVIWGRGKRKSNNHEIYLNDKIGVLFHVLYSRLTGKNGFASKRATKVLLKKINEINPDIIHLHNIHGYYINIELLFKYLKKNKKKVVWTLHDCWSFTGQCPYFDFVKCERWKKECYNCPMIGEYPKTFLDNSRWNYKKKKELFSGLDITIVTPSEWLASLVKQSFMGEYNVKVINNGIDTSLFKPTKGNFREKYNIGNKKIILGIASVWDRRKGLNDFLELSKIIDNNKYQIVIIGLNKRQINKIPNNIIGITRTENQKELIELYSESDIFFNPTYEDNYPTTNIEAICCGTKVITYNTGGSPEIAKYNGYVLDKKTFFENVDKYCENKEQQIVGHDFSIHKMYNEYLKIYKEITGDK